MGYDADLLNGWLSGNLRWKPVAKPVAQR
jgi:hypothetical protein